MTKITPNIVKHPIANIEQKNSHGEQQPTQPTLGPESYENDIRVRKFRGLIERANVFFRWGRVKKIVHTLSIRPVEAVDRRPLRNISNEALVAKLTKINQTLKNAKLFAPDPQTLAEINLGSVMINEHIRRLLLVINANDNPNKNALTPEDKELTS